MKLYRIFHYLSFDIVLGVLASSLFAARLFKAQPGWAWWVTLGLTVWLLYTGDHLLDAWRHRKKGLRSLHQFMFKHRSILLWCLGVTGIVDLLLIFNFLDPVMLRYALLLAGMVLLFYALRHLFRRNRVLFIPGEFFVLLIYMAGTWLGPFVARERIPLNTHAPVAIMFAGVLLMNLGVISLYDVKLDTRMGIASLARTLGSRTTRNLLTVTGTGIYLLMVFQFLVFGLDRYARFALILSGMASILFLELFLPSFFRRNEAYRWTADAVLYMGFLSLLVGPE